jgi:hypothetical protein
MFDGLPDAPVEILFIDGAKSWRGVRHLMRTLAEGFLPRKTLLVCQDFKYWGPYWVPIFVMTIRDHIEPVHDVLSASTVSFRLIKPVSPDVLSSLPDHVAELPRKESLEKICDAANLLERFGDIKSAN